MSYDQSTARDAARVTLDAQRILTVWRIGYTRRDGRRLVTNHEHMLSFQAADRKADLCRALGYTSVEVTPLLVYTHDYAPA